MQIGQGSRAATKRPVYREDENLTWKGCSRTDVNIIKRREAGAWLTWRVTVKQQTTAAGPFKVSECDPTSSSTTTEIIVQSYNIIPHLLVSALMWPGFIDIILAGLTDMWQKCQANHQKTRLPKLCIISIWNEWWCSLLLWHFVFAKSNCIIISYVQETEGNIQCYFPYFLLSIRPSK